MKNISRFERIKWEDIPDYGLYSEQLMHFLDDNLISYFSDTLSISPSMVNNYVKQGVIDSPVNKKYYRGHIACLIVVIILKTTFPLERIRQTMDYQLSRMSREESYNMFMDILENSLSEILSSFESSGEVKYKGFIADMDNITLTLAVHAFCFQTLTRYFLEASDALGGHASQ